jgi:predicted AlkP superfamily phosphohydrolase/phosphomutase
MVFGREKRVLVIGLDGATLDIIKPLMMEGKLPNLSRMAANGVYGKLFSTILPLSPTAWTSFSSGKNAGKHGIYDFSKRAAGSYDFALTTSLDDQADGLWDIIGSYNGRSIVVNVPLTYPPKPLNGVMISGFPTPTTKEDYTYPKELLPILKEEFGSIHIHKPSVLYRKGNEAEITDAVNEATRQQTAITRYLMRTMEWNLTVSVYDATDVIGHYFWAYIDRNHPKFDPKLEQPVRKLVEDVHVELDRGIGELLAEAGENSLRFVISDHGFGSVYYGVYINNWLLDQNYMHLKTNKSVRLRYWGFKHGIHTYNLLQLGKKLGLVRSIESAYATKSFMLKLLKTASLSLEDIDWTKTRVYSAGNFGQLYLNMKNREPNGIVAEEEAKPLLDELVVKLRKLEDPNTHRPMFDRIYSKYDVFQGKANQNAPDIVFFDENMMYAAHRMFELGSNKLVSLHPIYSGHHKMDGIVFAEGGGIMPLSGKMENLPNLVDVAPTILHYLGSHVPVDMDGRLLREWFAEDSEFSERLLSYQSENAEALRIRQSVSKMVSTKKL